MSGHIGVDPDAIVAAAGELDALAARIEAAAATHAAQLHPQPAGGEEVSVLATAHFNRLAAAFEPNAATAVAELRLAASIFRQQAAAYRAHDVAHAESLALAM